MYSAAKEVIFSKVPFSVREKIEKRAKEIINNWHFYYNGGNEWGHRCNYISFVRDVVKWESQIFKKYEPYEEACIYGGPRFMNINFCIVCERPKVRNTQIQNGLYVLHNETGPSIEWKCGTKAWHIDGLKVNEKIVMSPETQTVEEINAETNNDIRIVRLNRYGILRYLIKIDAKVIDDEDNLIEGTHECLLTDGKSSVWLLATCPSGRICPPILVPNTVQTCEQARVWLAGEKPFRVLART